MEKKIVPITVEESEKVEKLYMEFTGYCEILGYLSKVGSIDTDKFDKKWTEAIEINYELEQLKSSLYEKYKPENYEQYTSYVFNFQNHEMVFMA